jgi:site-specific DNA recombinase
MEEDIKLKFINAYNVSMKDRNRVMQDTAEIIDLLSDTTQLEQDIEHLNDDLIVVAELVNRLIKENSKTNTSLDDYNKRYEELRNRYEKTKKKQEELIMARNDKKAQALNMKTFLSNLRNIDDKLSDWNEHVWMLMVESAVVHRDTSITFKFHNGMEIRSS